MKRRNIIHRHARLRSGAGVHSDKRVRFDWRNELASWEDENANENERQEKNEASQFD